MDAWNGLSEAQQAIIETACEAGVTHAIAKAEALQGPVLTKFREEHGVTAVTMPDDVLKALHKASAEVMEEESANSEDFKRVYESQLAFQRQHQPWKELGYLPRNWPVDPE
jgi:TRAP-type mannitol/chloroaromatic compound transport system substrate-binding protein